MASRPILVPRLAAVALATAALLAASGGPPADGEAEGPVLRFFVDPAEPLFGTLAVDGLSAEVVDALGAAHLDRSHLAEVLSLRVADAPRGAPSILASVEVAAGTLLLRPRLPPRGGLTLLATFDGPRLLELLGLAETELPLLDGRFVMPRPVEPAPTVVEAVFPSAPEVPENLLRLYVHFSAPMRALDVARYVHLLDAGGGEVELPFVEVESGLWDPQQRRLTLFFHPGRIKRSVGPNLALGPPLRAGETYTLVVDRQLRDAGGQPLGASFRTSLVVGPPDRTSPDPRAWILHPPRGPLEPLIVELDEPLDHALLQRLMAVELAGGVPLAGSVEVSDAERRWSFVPRDGWQDSGYLLVVSPAIEDRAGNRPGALFDVPTPGDGGPGSSTEPNEPIELPFRVRLATAGG